MRHLAQDECVMTTCGLLSPESGTVYSFGENKLGQLGQGNQTDAVLTPATVSCFSLHPHYIGLVILVILNAKVFR